MRFNDGDEHYDHHIGMIRFYGREDSGNHVEFVITREALEDLARVESADESEQLTILHKHRDLIRRIARDVYERARLIDGRFAVLLADIERFR